MKTHYKQPFIDKSFYTSCRVHLTDDSSFVSRDYRDATCIRCIAAMSPGEKMYHDKNNKEWIEHKAKDGRRKGIKKPVVIQCKEVDRKVPIEKKESGFVGFIKSLFGV